MTKQNLEIRDFEDKKTQAGARYTRFQTDKGYMSCFDNTTAEQIKKYEKQIACVEVKEVGKFKNIEKCYGPEDSSTQDEEQVQIQQIPKTPTTTATTERTQQLNRIAALNLAIKVGNSMLRDKYYNYITAGSEEQ